MHWLLVEVMAANAQLPPGAPSLVNVTVPKGAVAPDPAVSVTTAVQVIVEPIWTTSGLHETVVEVGRLVMPRGVVFALPK